MITPQNDLNIYSSIPAKNSLKKIYEDYTPCLEQIMQKIKDSLIKEIKLSSQPTYKARIKSFESYYKKVLRQHPKEAAESSSLVCLTDMMGIRIICTFLEDIQEVREQISAMFDVKEIEIKGANQSFREFGYESIHVLIGIPKEFIPDNLPDKIKIPDELVCEIQIRTILQDAWAEVEHELIYKTEFTPFDMPLRRKLASMNASLSLADIIFQEIRDYQKNLQTEMNTRRRSFYEKADELTDSMIGKSVQEKSIERVNPYVHGTIDEMILSAIRAHNLGDLETAIKIYTRIIESKPAPNNVVLGVIHKHRGMAYFAKNDYDNALLDFKKSFELDKTSFRSIYYEGIVYSIQKKYEQAIECFSKSLELNEYQSHAFFRRAIAYYELSQYENAMNDIVAAQRLGLEDPGLEELHSKLMKKFDMDM